jgi:hypothetical protein
MIYNMISNLFVGNPTLVGVVCAVTISALLFLIFVVLSPVIETLFISTEGPDNDKNLW